MLPVFYPILDTALLRARSIPVPDAARALLSAGAGILQYRHKDVWTQADYDEAEEVSGLCGQAGIPFLVNDRADFAKLLGAALHIGQDDLPPAAARKIVGDVMLGLSTHNRRQLSFGEEEPVDYLSLGPIFTTTSKQNPDPVLGVSGLKKLRPLTAKPIVAIGGITLENAAETIAAGADSLAVISGFVPEDASILQIEKRAAAWLRLTK